MDRTTREIHDFLSTLHPYDALSPAERARVAAACQLAEFRTGDEIYAVGQTLPGLFLVLDGAVEVRDRTGGQISLLGPRNSFGERGLMRAGVAVTAARAADDCRLIVLPVAEFRRLLAEQRAVARFFQRGRQDRPGRAALATTEVRHLLGNPPITVGPETTLREAAVLMRDRAISSLPVIEDGRLTGIVTTTDLSHRAVAEALPLDLPVSRIMTPNPLTLPPGALASDVLHLMHERHIGHLPICEDGRLVGMVTRTDLSKLQAVTSAHLISAIAGARTPAGMARATAEVPQLLVQLVGSANRHEVVTRLISDIADAVTRRLLKVAEAKIGPPPVPYAWLAFGRHGRRELSGIGEQANALLLDDRVTAADLGYFDRLAGQVCEGLAECGYAPAEAAALATDPAARRSASEWRAWAADRIASPEAPVPVSLLFDLRVVGGEAALADGLRPERLAAAAASPRLMAAMAEAARAAAPPLGLLRGFATLGSGEHLDRIDLGRNGVTPVVDLARLHAVLSGITAVGTRARLAAGRDSPVLTAAATAELLDAYDLIAQTRLDHQARLIRRGRAPNDLVVLAAMSDFERSHLRDAFVVVTTAQSGALSALQSGALADGGAAPAP